MPTAKQLFLDRIAHFRQSLNVSTLNDLSAANVLHNNVAKLLRNGLAVVGFVALEDFIKKRTGEVLKEVSATSLPFNLLPIKIQETATVDVISALLRLVRNENALPNKINFIQQEAAKIASTLNARYDLTEFAFGYKNSNLKVDEIKQILTAFQIQDGWSNMTRLSSRIGLTSFPLDNSFINASDRRHNAAHAAHANTPINDLKQYINEALGIAISFDLLLSKALSLIKLNDSGYLSSQNKIMDNHLKLSFLKNDQSLWKYYRENSSRAINVNSDINILLQKITPKVNSNKENLIKYDQSGDILDWTT